LELRKVVLVAVAGVTLYGGRSRGEPVEQDLTIRHALDLDDSAPVSSCRRRKSALE